MAPGTASVGVGPPEPGARQIWTIGHWVCPQEVFLQTLATADVDTLVDVRSHPGSRRSPQFGRIAMPAWLNEAGIDYLPMGERLGGRRPKQPDVPPDVNAGWHNASFKNYADYALGADFRAGLAELIAVAETHRVAIMCGEPMPWRCHRLLIANNLTALGWTVWHLSTTEPARRHELGAWGAEPVIAPDGTLSYPTDATE